MIIKPYLLVPKLIPQPTWGGTYIADFKGLDPAIFGSLLIGQSYELATDSTLSTVLRSSLLPIEIGTASDGSTQEVMGDKSTCFSLQALIESDPEGVLGKRVAEIHKNRMQLLIKFTQAKGNSFQVHVRPGVILGNWKPKPESWYFFEKGKVTLGLRRPIELDAYKQACKDIEIKAGQISERIKDKSQSVELGRRELQDFISTHSPFAFVNELTVEPQTIVDLSAGGIHHSWEEGDEIPNGNIVYEVQLNVMDKECTLRSFDKGKIGDDGSLRPVHVDDYFTALDTNEARNDPNAYMRLPMMHGDTGVDVASLFDSLHYKSSLISISREYHGNQTTTQQKESFHHIFVKDGDIEVQTKYGTLNAAKGSSVFVPANVGEYTVRTTDKALVIKTWA